MASRIQIAAKRLRELKVAAYGERQLEIAAYGERQRQRQRQKQWANDVREYDFNKRRYEVDGTGG